MKKQFTYKQAGVDIDKANRLVEDIKKLVGTTRVKGTVGSIGGFGGVFDLAKAGGKGTLLVASTDGVGTKLKIAHVTGKHDTIGIDLVAMCVNDILCCGARPIFFLDYFATGKLEAKTWEKVLKGIVNGCRQARCSLLGGETAEMPGMYAKGEYDLAGFGVGVVEKNNIIDGSSIRPGDCVLGIASSGLHSNGYSLVRKIFSEKEIKRNGKMFLEPTFIYVQPVLETIKKVKVKGIANITGGGFYDKIARILPAGARVVIRKDSWKQPRIFSLIREKADIGDRELYRTFNMGIGMVMVLSRKDAVKAGELLKKKYGLNNWMVGDVVKGEKGVDII